jgi:hypothetical protein
LTEKRAFDRYTLWFPVTLDGEDSQVWAVCHDASAGGISLSGNEELRVGSTVTVVFRVDPDDPEERRVQGKVVRVDGFDDDPRTVWRHRMAVEFDEPVPELQALFKRASTRPPPAP